MQIVINIPDDDYMVLEKWFRLENLNGTLEQRLFCAVANGTVLPKGHGDLIDRDVAFDEFDKACCSYEGGLLKYIPTVIPADKK